MLKLLLVEDNAKLRAALKPGLESSGNVAVIHDCDTGEAALAFCLEQQPDAILMDVRLASKLNGIEAGVEIRREFPRMPIVFYSIQDDDAYFRDFRKAGILSHYAYVRKSNYLLPEMIITLLRDAIAGKSFIDPEIESRVEEVRHKDENSPFNVLEPAEQSVARMLAIGMTNEQIAAKMGFRDKRTISRINGQVYAVWGLAESATDEKIARTRASIIAQEDRWIRWDVEGIARMMNEKGEWIKWKD